MVRRNGLQQRNCRKFESTSFNYILYKHCIKCLPTPFPRRRCLKLEFLSTETVRPSFLCFFCSLLEQGTAARRFVRCWVSYRAGCSKQKKRGPVDQNGQRPQALSSRPDQQVPFYQITAFLDACLEICCCALHRILVLYCSSDQCGQDSSRCSGRWNGRHHCCKDTTPTRRSRFCYRGS
jgi:hypothetical protein